VAREYLPQTNSSDENHLILCSTPSHLAAQKNNHWATSPRLASDDPHHKSTARTRGLRAEHVDAACLSRPLQPRQKWNMCWSTGIMQGLNMKNVLETSWNHHLRTISHGHQVLDKMIKSGRFVIPGLWSSWLASSPSTSPFILPSHLGVNDRYFEIRGNDLLKELS